MARSKWKGTFSSKSLLKNLFFPEDKEAFLGDKEIKIWSRKDIILENYIGKVLTVYNGKIFKRIFVSREKIGFKLGNFSHTRIHNPCRKKVVNKKGKK